MSTVLVTGGSGFVGSHCILQLLTDGHSVRTTLRSLGREKKVRKMVVRGGGNPDDRLSFFVADLESESGWEEALAGVEYVLHVASPFPPTSPTHEDELIVSAREGTLIVLKNAKKTGVKRVVLTSSFGAIGYGHPDQAEPFDETSWTNLEGNDVGDYIKSKTIAERAAWDYICGDGQGLELTVINPVGIFGPVLDPDLSSSVQIVEKMLDGSMGACPRIYFGAVDVRDVAELHVRAMTHPAAAGERFIAVAGPSRSMLEMAKTLREGLDAEGLGSFTQKIPTEEVSDSVLIEAAKTKPELQSMLPQLGRVRNSTSDKASRILNWLPRTYDAAITATGKSLIQFGIS